MTINRLIELEIKAAYQEDLLITLNTIVSEQQQRITRLENTCQLLNDNIKRLSGQAQGGEAINSAQEIPPHY
ncbi:MAG: SlyX family protein [Methylococcaceae bacterium]